MSQTKPSIVGFTTSLAVGVGYILCAIAVALFPGISYSFFSSLFHGANVSSLEPQPGAFTFGPFLVALVILMIWGFAVGTFYSWVLNILTRNSSESLAQYSSPKVSPSRV